MKKANTTNQTIFSIYAEDRKGLVGQVLIHFNKRNFDVRSLNVARTDISDLVMLTVEAVVPAVDLLPFTERLKKIVEVYAITRSGEMPRKTGFFRLAAAALNNDLWLLMGKYGAALSSMGEKSLVICKTGSDEDLDELYEGWRGRICRGFVRAV